MITYLKEPHKELHLKSIFHPIVNKWFFSKFKKFTEAQLFAVYPIHCRENVLVSSPTGSGKTLTAFLSILNELIDSSQKGILEDRVYAIYVSPLKALSHDIAVNLEQPLKEMEELAGKPLGIRLGIRTGDTTAYQKSKMTKLSPHILITTPESLAIVINSPKFKEHLKKTQWLLIDEIHALAENKRGVHLNVTMERLQHFTPDLTRVGLSATIAPLENIARYLVGYQGDEERDCKIVDVRYAKKMDFQVISPVKSLVETDYMMKHKKMYETMHTLIQQHKTTLIFTNTRAATERVVHNLKEMYPQDYQDRISAHHGSLSKENRFQTEQDLREGKLKVVCCSTSLELGIDIGYIDLVLCLGSPKSVARFLQRCLPYDAPILLEDGSYQPIGKIVEEQMEVKVVSYSTKGFIFNSISQYHKNPTENLLEFRFGSTKYQLTAEHPLLTKEGWIPAKNLKPGQPVAQLLYPIDFKYQKEYIYTLLPRSLTYVYGANDFFRTAINRYLIENKISLKVFSKRHSLDYRKITDLRRIKGRKKSILLDDFVKVCTICEVQESEYVQYLHKLKYKGKSWCKFPIQIDSGLMWLAGLIATDGCIVRSRDNRYGSIYHRVKFGNMNADLIQKFKEVLAKYEIGYHHSIRKENGFHQIEVGNNLFAHLLFSLGLPWKNKSSSLELSDKIFKMRRELVLSFLEGVFEGDGSYNKKYPMIRIFTGSPAFAQQLHSLFARLGIHSKVNSYLSKTSKQVRKINIKEMQVITLTRVADVKFFLTSIPKWGPKARDSYGLARKFKQHHKKKSKRTKYFNWTKIDSITTITNKQPTYNLTIHQDSNFIVGNIITHNCGRAGHQLDGTIKGRVIVMDRDDLVECSLLLKSAIEKKIDKVHIPLNALDVLAQHIFGIVINEITNIYTLFHLIKNCYCYHTLTWDDFFELIKFLSGQYVSLEERHVYARIWYDQETGDIGKKGKMARIIYMTNIGTIPEEGHIKVKVGEHIVGAIDEAFLERMRPGDVFVLGGNVYMFKFARGMTAQVSTSVNRPPTVPSWFSEMLPLSFDLAMEINRFRRLMDDRFSHKAKKQEILDFIDEYLYVDEKAKESIYQYFYEQYNFSVIPSDKKIIIEQYMDRGRLYVIFNTLFGRRVNDCLSRALAFVIGRSQHRDVELGITDNGFYLSAEKQFNAVRAFSLLQAEDLRNVLEQSIEKSEVLSRRFRHCAGRSLMILRSYMGRKKRAGRMQIGSKILFNAVKRISNNFPILKEARREVLEDLMDYEHAQQIIKGVNLGDIAVVETANKIPSPFAFTLIAGGYSDVIKIEDKQEFLRRMHQEVMLKIALKKGKKIVKEEKEFSYSKYWDAKRQEALDDKDLAKEKLKMQVWNLKIPVYVKQELVKLIEFGSCRKDVLKELKQVDKEEWPEEIKEFVNKKG